MCGIAGRIAGEVGGRVDPVSVEVMCELMAHRGPDGRGVLDAGRAVLGHVRLSIIDLAGGRQPLAGCTSDVQVTFNGEIYNHLLLRAELEARGHRFRTHSDTEVLAHGWEEWGEALPEKLRGMFAFALWDARRQVCFLSRDRLGKKPLYHARAGRDLVFASEVKALFVHPDVERGLDTSQLPAWLALRYVPGPATLFRGVQRLQPGHSLLFQDGEVSVRRYWDVPFPQEPDERLCEAEQVEHFLQLFNESVRLRLMSDVPVGVFLSGGIDSSAVAWSMCRHARGPVKSFSIGYEGDPEGELTHARLAAGRLGTEHHEVVLTPGMFGDFMPELAWHLDEPIADAACVPLFYLSLRARREGVIVVLSGEGADEVLAGYPIYRKQLVMERLRRLGPLIDRVAPPLARAVNSAKVQKYLGWVAQPLEERYLGVSRAFTNEALVSSMLGGLSGPSGAERLRAYYDRTRGLSPLARMLYNDSKVWLPDDLLIKADKMSMAASVELRVPFLDHELLALCWSLPEDLKLRGGVGKYLLRRAMAGKLPEEILTRKKKGFPVPTGEWIRGPLYAQCREALLASKGACRALFPARLVGQLLDEHRAGTVDRTQELYALWILGIWYERFLGNAPLRPGTARTFDSRIAVSSR